MAERKTTLIVKAAGPSIPSISDPEGVLVPVEFVFHTKHPDRETFVPAGFTLHSLILALSVAESIGKYELDFQGDINEETKELIRSIPARII